MGNLGPGELILIMAIALIVFGPKKLPEIGRGIGKAMREFNKARNDFMETIHSTEVDLDEPPAKTYSSEPQQLASGTTGDYPAGTVPRSVEYPAPLQADQADALPYGTDFNTVEGDSQPSFRTAQPEPKPAAAAASEGKA
jgi:sec-independent protein translocase protein TatA